MRQKHWLVPLIIILIVGFFLRIFNLTDLFYFTHDEETIVWRVMPLLRDKNLFLLGGVTPLHVHLGPWFYYLSAAILFLSHLDPIGWGVAATIFGTFSTFTLFFLCRHFYNQKTAFFASALYATSFLMVAFDRHWWPLSLNPLLGIISLYCLGQIAQKKHPYAIPLGLSLALGFHSDPSTWALIILAFVTWLKFKLFNQTKATVLALTIILLSFLPLVAFDLKNSGTNILSINQYLEETKPQQGLSFSRFSWTLLYIPRTLGRLLYSDDTELTHQYAYCPELSQSRLENASLVTTFISIVVLIYFIASRSRKKIDWIIKAYLAIIIIGINVYGNFFSSDLFDHYLATLFPIFFLIFAIFLTRLHKYIATGLLIFIVTINLFLISKMTNQHGYTDKTQAVNWTISQLDNQPFALQSIGKCHGYSGIRYLFTLAGHEPHKSFVDQNFSWLYKQKPTAEVPKKFVVFVFPDQNNQHLNSTYFSYLQNIKKRQSFGSLEVLIVDNQQQQYKL